MQLIRSKWIPCLLYAIEAFPVDKSRGSVRWILPRINENLPNSINWRYQCRRFSGCVDTKLFIARRRLKFLDRFLGSDNSVLWRMLHSCNVLQCVNLTAQDDTHYGIRICICSFVYLLFVSLSANSDTKFWWNKKRYIKSWIWHCTLLCVQSVLDWSNENRFTDLPMAFSSSSVIGLSRRRNSKTLFFLLMLTICDIPAV